MSTTVFYKDAVIARGDPRGFADTIRALQPIARTSDLLAFDDETGRQVDLELHGSGTAARSRGRPALGVESREISLLPRHWEWLSRQPGSASVTLRKIVEEAMRRGRTERERQDAAYRFLTVIAGDRPGYEEAIRALYAGDRENFDALAMLWPDPIADHARLLAWPDGQA
ncbi:DUF2239 family protein [Novosphingobium colocasiae]|uniref:DUF2239 family protein n=1 Tax=Novosphingobium colocasiae TaxID=1256513 RepID=UPI0035B43964